MELKGITSKDLTDTLAYSGLILLAFELVKGMIVKPIIDFYDGVIFGPGMPFKSYEEDVASRHKNTFEACLMYLRDFMEAIDDDDFRTIQSLRKHRNSIAHELPTMLSTFSKSKHMALLERTNKVLFKLSNYRIYMEIGADPHFANQGINWDTIKGPEYELFEEILNKLRFLENSNKDT